MYPIQALGIIIGGKHGMATAGNILARMGSFDALSQLSVPALRALGVPQKGAERLAAACHLLHDYIKPKVGDIITSPEELFELLTPKYARLETERIGAVIMNGRNRVLQVGDVAHGDTNCVTVPFAGLFRTAIRLGSSRIVLYHNHPSGDPKPSPEDVAMTRRAIRLGQQLGIEVLDHVIIAHNGCVSMQERDPYLFAGRAGIGIAADAGE